MYRILLGISLLMFSLSYAFAQAPADRPTTRLGPDLEQKRHSPLHTLLGSDDDGGVYALKTEEKGINFQHYGSDLRLQKSVPLEIGKQQFQQAFLFGGRLIVFSSKADKKDKKHFLYARPFDKKTLRPASDPILILTTPMATDMISKLKNIRNYGDFQIKLSPDSSKIAIAYDGALPTGGMKIIPLKKNPGSVMVKIIDTELQTVWEQHSLLPLEDYAFKLKDFATDDSGAAYFLFFYQARAKRRKMEGATGRNAYYQVWRMGPENGSLSRVDLNTEGRYLNGLQLVTDLSGERIAIAGFYGTKKSLFSKVGSACFWLETRTMEVTNSWFVDFSPALLVPETRGKKHKVVGIADLHLIRAEIDDNGNLLLIGEQQTLSESSTWDPGSKFNSSSITHVYKDLVVLRLSREGELRTMARVPKNQRTARATFSSVAHFVAGEEVYLLFNDNRSNLDKTLGDKLLPFTYNHRQMVTVLASVAANGAVKKELLFTGEKSGVFLRPDLLLSGPSGELFGYGHWNKVHRLIRINIPGMVIASR